MFDSLKRAIVTYLVGHPLTTSHELLAWTPEHIKNGDRWHEKANSGLLTVDDMIYLRKRGDRFKHLKGKTFVINMNSILGTYLSAVNNTNANYTDTGGTGRASLGVTGITNIMDATGGAGVSTYGLVVGSNNTAVTRTDTKLNTQIAHGATSTTLSHGSSSVSAITNPSGTITRTQCQRSVTGNAGSTVNIQEDGLYVNATSNNWKFCLYRNVNSFGAVSAAQVVTVTLNVDTTS